MLIEDLYDQNHLNPCALKKLDPRQIKWPPWRSYSPSLNDLQTHWITLHPEIIFYYNFTSSPHFYWIVPDSQTSIATEKSIGKNSYKWCYQASFYADSSKKLDHFNYRKIYSFLAKWSSFLEGSPYNLFEMTRSQWGQLHPTKRRE